MATPAFIPGGGTSVRLGRCAAALIALFTAGVATPAFGQRELDVQTFVPPAGRAAVITILEPELPAHGTLRLGLTTSWARWPLVRQVDCTRGAVLVDSSCLQGERDGRTPVISDLATADLTLAAAFYGALQLGVAVPGHVVRRADDLERPQRLANRVRFGDVRLSIDAPLIQGATAVALTLIASLPTGDGASLVGARTWTAAPALVLRQRLGAVVLAGSFGVRLRERAELLGLVQDDELDAALGGAWAVSSDLALQLEWRLRAGVLGATSRRNESPAEAALAVRWELASGTALAAGASRGAWPGRSGYGAPLARFFVAVQQTLAPSPCALGPEDRDGFLDADGCRDPDNDGDGVKDDADACPNDAEDRDGFEDGDGCPDWDDDADGLADADDRCPRDSEDRDGFEDADGCPERDNDEDGLSDGADACANDPEDRDGFEDGDGCPEPGPRPVSISVGEERILVSERIYFDDDADTIRAVSGPVLDQLAEVMRGLPAGVKVLVEGHTDDSGNPAYNLDLSYRRATAVVEYLKARGVPEERLEAAGHGATQPLAPNDSPEGRALNRRVEFLLVR